jgi:hypothetical protein
MKAGPLIIAAATLLTASNAGAVNLARDGEMTRTAAEHGKRGVECGAGIPCLVSDAELIIWVSGYFTDCVLAAYRTLHTR